MPLPYYVSPEQIMKDKAEYARKGISRGKAIVAIEYRDGVLLVAENPSTLLHKVSEIYDRIAFAGVGKYNEFENLRVAGVRLADVKGYSYSRGDVSAKSLANAYSQALGNIFTQDIKPFEVEVLVVEVGDGNNGTKNEIYHILYDGTIEDEKNYAAMGGQSDEIRRYLKDNYQETLDFAAAVKLGVRALMVTQNKTLTERDLEVAVLDRGKERRKFRRIPPEVLHQLLADDRAALNQIHVHLSYLARRPTPLLPWSANEEANLRDRERVRPHLHPERPAAAVARQCRAVSLREGHPGRPQRQCLPRERRPPLSRHGLPSGVRHARVRRHHRPRHPRQGGRAHRRGPASSGGEAASRGRHLRPHPALQEQYGLRGQLLWLPRELPRQPGRVLPAAGRRAHPLLRHAPDLRGRRQGAPDAARLSLLPEPACPAHLPGDLGGHDVLALHHQYARRAPCRCRALPAPARDRGRLEHVRGRNLSEGRHHRPHPGHDRGWLLRQGL